MSIYTLPLVGLSSRQSRTVAEIKFIEWTTGDVLRYPEVVALRDDKAPAEVFRDP
jgi:ATP-dependent DNA ligase